MKTRTKFMLALLLCTFTTALAVATLSWTVRVEWSISSTAPLRGHSMTPSSGSASDLNSRFLEGYFYNGD